MNKNQILDQLENRWSEFKESFAGLDEKQMTRVPSKGGWSIKDILVHVAAWDEQALKNLPLIVEGKRLPRYRDLYGGINAFNAMTAEKHRDLPLSEALRQLDQTHKRLLAYLRSVPEEQFEGRSRFRRRLSADTYNHYPEHTETILKLRG